MSLGMQIAFSAWAGVAFAGLALLFGMGRERKMPTGWQVALSLPAAAFVATSVFDQIHQGGLPRTGRLLRGGVLLFLFAIALAGSVRVLRIFWRDEEELVEQFGSSEGYIPRRRIIPLRYKALLAVLFGAAAMAAISYFYFAHLLDLESV